MLTASSVSFTLTVAAETQGDRRIDPGKVSCTCMGFDSLAGDVDFDVDLDVDVDVHVDAAFDLDRGSDLWKIREGEENKKSSQKSERVIKEGGRNDKYEKRSECRRKKW